MAKPLMLSSHMWQIPYLVKVADQVVHKAPALTATRIKSIFRPPPANKICLNEHSNQPDQAMGRQERVSLLHWISALVFKEQHLDKTQTCRQDGSFSPWTSLNTTEKSKVSLLLKVQPLFRAVEPFCRNCSNWCRIDKWVISPSLFFLLFLPPWNHSALRKQDIRKMSSGSLLQRLVCLQALVSSSDQPLSSSPEVAVFRHDLPPLHSSLCLWNVQRSAPRCLHKETCFGDSCLASAPPHVPVISHHVTKLKGIPGV